MNGCFMKKKIMPEELISNLVYVSFYRKNSLEDLKIRTYVHMCPIVVRFL